MDKGIDPMIPNESLWEEGLGMVGGMSCGSHSDWRDRNQYTRQTGKEWVGRIEAKRISHANEATIPSSTLNVGAPEVATSIF